MTDINISVYDALDYQITVVTGLDDLSGILDTKVDKIEGKGLSTNDYTTAEKAKLAGIAPSANNYVHPSTHPPSIIAQDIDNRFVTDAEKTTWNNKSDFDSSYNSLTDKPDLSSLHSHSNKALLDTYTQTEADIADAISKEHTHSNKTDLDGYSPSLFATASHNHAISDVTNLQTTLDGKQASLGFTAENSANKENVTIDTSITKYPTVNLLKIGLDSKANTSHTHVISDVTNLQTTLDGKANTSHTHAISDVSDLQTTLDGKASSSHNHTLSNITDFPATVSATEIGYLDGVTSAIQTQINGKANTSHTHTKSQITDIQTLFNGTGTSTADVNTMITPGVNSLVRLADNLNAPSSDYYHIVVIQHQASGNLIQLAYPYSLSATDKNIYMRTLYGTWSSWYAIPTQSLIDTALSLKANLASPTFTGTVTLPSTTSIGTVSNVEIGYLDGVTSAIQTQINSKQATITGGATTIVSSNLTASRLLVSDGGGKVAVLSVTSTEAGYLSGVTSAIQTQINGKHKLFNFTTGTSLTIDGATYNFHTLSVSVNSSFSLSNLTTGLLYEFLVKNTGAGSITITIPNTSDVRVADTVTIATGKAREFSLLWDGTIRYWQVSEELIGA